MEDIELVKSKTNIVELVNAYTPIKKLGKNYKGLCPFHKEKTASFIVSDEIGRYRCFGCGKSGDAINFLMDIENLSFADALNMLALKAGVKLSSNFKEKKDSDRNEVIYQINNYTMLFYQNVLFKTKYGKLPLEYLKSRHIDVNIAIEYKLGYAIDSWSQLSTFLAKRGFRNEDMIKAGVLLKGKKGFYDVFRNRLMIPLADQFGRIIGFSGRAFNDSKPKYLNTSETAIFHKQNFLYNLDKAKTFIREKGEVIVVEGYFDAISVYKAGLKNVVATSGTAITESHISILKRYTDTIVLFLDSDKAGMDASLKGIDIISSQNINIKIALLPEGYKDPDDLAIKDSNLLSKCVNNSVPIWDFYFIYAKKYLSVKNVFDREKTALFLKEKSGKIFTDFARSEYLKNFADFFDMSLSDARQYLSLNAKYNIYSKMANAKPDGEITGKSGTAYRYYRNEAYSLALTFSLEYDKMIYYINQYDSKYYSSDKFKVLLSEIKEFLLSKANFNIKDFYDYIYKEKPDLKDTIDQILLFNFDTEIQDEDFLVKESELTLNRLKTQYISRRLKELSKLIKKAEQDSNQNEVNELVEEVKALQAQKF